MGRAPDFIGLGAQRAGTSWMYACLYEHPNVCIPVKEIHFFSRDRNWHRGYAWYEETFQDCASHAKVGEFSTSYLEDAATPERIWQRYPGVQLIVSLRNPIQRAYSNYMNDMTSGAVQPTTSFSDALRAHPEYLSRGRYGVHLDRYLQYFARDQILVLVYEESLKDPQRFIQTVYRFVGVAPSFVPSLVGTKVNAGRIPRWVWVDRVLRKASAVLQPTRFHRFWWLAKKAGFGNRLRALNSQATAERQRVSLPDRRFIYAALENDIQCVEKFLGQELQEWRP